MDVECVLFGKKKPKYDFSTEQVISIIDNVKKNLELDKGEKLIGCLPLHMGIRDFDPTHSYSCASARDKIKLWRLGIFINTSKHVIFKQIEKDGSTKTAFNVPLVTVYTAEVSGINEKQLELCTNAGSFEFKGFTGDTVYQIAKGIQGLADYERKAETLRDYTPAFVVCEYCKVKNKLDSSFCVNCGSPLKAK